MDDATLIQEPLRALPLPIEVEEALDALEQPMTVVMENDTCTYVKVRKGTDTVLVCFEEPQK